MEKNYTNLGFETSNACNANCSFCAYKFMKRKPKVISNELTYKVAKIIMTMGEELLTLLLL